jgi:small redox-active disulfide protein 2
MEIRILGTGCAKCDKLMEETRLAAAELGLECDIDKVGELKQIMAYGVMITPALVVNGSVKVVGKVPSREEIKKMLS